MIINNTIGTSNTTIKSAPAAGETHLIVTMFLCNVHSTTEEVVSVWAVPNGGSATDGTKIVADYTIEALDTEIFNLERLPLEEGDTLVAIGDNGNVTATIGYLIA